MSRLVHPPGSSMSGSLEAGQPVLLSTSTRMPWQKTAAAPSPRAAGDMTPEAATAFEMLMEISVDIDQSQQVAKTPPTCPSDAEAREKEETLPADRSRSDFSLTPIVARPKSQSSPAKPNILETLDRKPASTLDIVTKQQPRHEKEEGNERTNEELLLVRKQQQQRHEKEEGNERTTEELLLVRKQLEQRNLALAHCVDENAWFRQQLQDAHDELIATRTDLETCKTALVDCRSLLEQERVLASAAVAQIEDVKKELSRNLSLERAANQIALEERDAEIRRLKDVVVELSIIVSTDLRHHNHNAKVLPDLEMAQGGVTRSSSPTQSIAGHSNTGGGVAISLDTIEKLVAGKSEHGFCTADTTIDGVDNADHSSVMGTDCKTEQTEAASKRDVALERAASVVERAEQALKDALAARATAAVFQGTDTNSKSAAGQPFPFTMQV